MDVDTPREGEISEVDRPAAIAASSVLGAVCVAPVLLVPLIIGAVAERYPLGPHEMGIFNPSIFGAGMLVVASAALWVRKVNWRITIACGSLVALIAYVLAGLMPGFLSMTAMVYLAGAGAGLALAPSMCALSDTREPDRNFGYSFFVQIVVGAATGFVGAILAERWGLPGVLGLMGVLFVIPLAMIRYFPVAGTKSAATVKARQSMNSLGVWLGLGGMLLLTAGPAAVWTFYERIGSVSGFSHSAIGNTIAMSLLAGAPGALLSSAWANKFGRILPLTVSTILMVGTYITAVTTRELSVYFASGLVLQFMLNFGLAYQFGALSSVDKSGRAIVLAPLCQGVGGIYGPVVAAHLVQSDRYWPGAPFAAGVMTLGGLVLVVWLCRIVAAAPVIATVRDR